MKILLITGIFPPDIGGPATYVPSIAGGLAARGHAITVLILSDRVDYHDSGYPFPVVRLPRRLPKPWRVLRTVWAIWRLGKEADVLFVNGLALESALANSLLRKPLVMKVVGDLAWERATNWGWTADGFEAFQTRRWGWKVELLKALRSWWTRRAHRVIVPSRYLASWVARWGVPEDRIEVIYNAVEPMDGMKPVPVPLSTPVKFVTVGRLVPWKRVDDIVRAVAEIPEAGLVVVGDGPERPRLEGLARSLGIQDRVYFAGARRWEETLGLMAACDIFVLNSTYEGLPHVVLEAMALGLPVVATAVGGTPEVVIQGVTGFFAPTDGSLGIALREIVNKPLWDSRFRSRIRELTLRDFALSAMLGKTEAVLLQTRSSSRRT